MRDMQYTGLNLLKIIAAFHVVTNHCPYYGTMCDTFSKFLPPANAVFALMAGFFMFKEDRQFSIATWLTRRVSRLIYPYVCWLILYLMTAFLCSNHFDFYNIFVPKSIGKWISVVFLNYVVLLSMGVSSVLDFLTESCLHQVDILGIPVCGYIVCIMQ